jgi:hypothetical protein
MKLSEELRSKPSRDNRALLDRAADRIDELESLMTELLITIGRFTAELQPSVNDVIKILGIVKGGAE